MSAVFVGYYRISLQILVFKKREFRKSISLIYYTSTIAIVAGGILGTDIVVTSVRSLIPNGFELKIWFYAFHCDCMRA